MQVASPANHSHEKACIQYSQSMCISTHLQKVWKQKKLGGCFGFLAHRFVVSKILNSSGLFRIALVVKVFVQKKIQVPTISAKWSVQRTSKLQFAK